jgi:hypothetical protein
VKENGKHNQTNHSNAAGRHTLFDLDLIAASAQTMSGGNYKITSSVSIEFQQTAYLRYLVQKESFGSRPKDVEFMRDVQEVSRGVIVNSPGWEQKIKDNQQQFAENSDLSGYNFWLNKLNQFGGNYVDAEMIKALITSFEYRGRFGQ